MPQRTLELIEELQTAHGMTDEYFRQIHPHGQKASIASHKKFCKGEKEFKAGSPSLIVRHRLEAVLEQRKTGAPWNQVIRAVTKG
jgi:hypothetical protein